MDDKIPGTDFDKVKVKILGEDGNGFAIMGRVLKAMKEAEIPKEIRDKYIKEVTSGDYNNLLTVTLQYVEDIGEEDNEGGGKQ